MDDAEPALQVVAGTDAGKRQEGDDQRHEQAGGNAGAGVVSVPAWIRPIGVVFSHDVRCSLNRVI